MRADPISIEEIMHLEQRIGELQESIAMLTQKRDDQIAAINN